MKFKEDSRSNLWKISGEVDGDIDIKTFKNDPLDAILRSPKMLI